jgi:hypothetical protein
MFFRIDLNQFFAFPFKDAGARKQSKQLPNKQFKLPKEDDPHIKRVGHPLF